MKLKVVFLLIGLVLGCFSYGQIKIGDQPQNIDPASVLELQSTSRALVLTRVNNTQMNAIRPLQGALVYNTETKCVHYYDGDQWLNICDALTNSVNISMVDNGDGSYTFTDAVGVETIITTTTNTTFEVANDSLVLTDSNNNALSVALDSLNRHTYSSDAVVNLPTSDSTIVITKTANNYNFEVGEITGLNILDRSITREDIAGTAINGDFHIQNRSTPVLKLVPGTNGQLLQTQTVTGQPTVVWVNKAGLFTAAEVSYDPTVSGLTATTVKLAIDEISTSSNSLTIGDILTQGNDAGAQLIRNVLDPSSAQDVATRNYVDTQLSNSNILADANIFVGDAAGTAQAVPVSGDATMDNTGALTISDNAVTSSKILDGTIDSVDIAPFSIGTPQLSNNSVTSVKILDGEVSTADIANDAVTTTKIADDNITLPKLANGTAAGQLMQWDGTNWVLVDDSALNVTEIDGIVGNEILDATDATLERFGTGSDLDPFTLDVSSAGIGTNELADGAVTTVKILDANVTTTKIADNNITTSKIADDNVTLPKLANGTAAGQLMQWDGTNWVLVDDSALNVTEIDGIVGNEILDATDATLERFGTGSGLDPFTLDVSSGGIGTNELADGAVTTVKILDANVTTTKIADNNITTSKIADDNVTLPKLANGTAAGQLMQWDGTNWVLVDDSALNVTEIDGIVGNEILDATDATLERFGTGSGLDPFTLDVSSGGIGTNELADGAVTTVKILDANVTTTKIADNNITTSKIADDNVTLPKLANGTAAGQLMQWDGTNWVLVDDSALNVTEIDGIVGNEILDATDATLERFGTGSDLDPFTLDVSSAGIGTNELADGAVTTVKILDANVTTTKIADNNITTSKIADDNVTLPKLANGTAAGQLMQWDGTNWVLVDDSALNVTEIDGIVGNEILDATDATLERFGTGSDLDPFTLDVSSAGIGTNELADGAVTTVKILDANVTTLKIADANVTPIKIEPSATNGQVLKTIGGTATWANQFHAIGKINTDGTTANTINAASSNIGLGNYQISFATPASSANYVIQLTLGTGPGREIRVTAQTINGFTIQITDSGNFSVDSDWYFTVTDF